MLASRSAWPAAAAASIVIGSSSRRLSWANIPGSEIGYQSGGSGASEGKGWSGAARRSRAAVAKLGQSQPMGESNHGR
jgi:hypothetical protein